MMGDMVADMVEPVYCRGGAGVLGTPAPPGLAATRRLALARTTGPMRVEPPLGGSLRGALVYRYPQLLRLHMVVAARSAMPGALGGRTRRWRVASAFQPRTPASPDRLFRVEAVL